MTLYDFFVQKEYQNAESILIRERKLMIQNAERRLTMYKQSTDSLEKYLNKLFYPKNTVDKKLTEQYMNRVVQAYESYTKKKLNNVNFSMDQELTLANPEAGFKMLRERWEHLNHKEEIQRNTLETRLKKVKEMIQKLPDLKSAIDNYDNIVEQANKLKEGLDQLIKKTGANEWLKLDDQDIIAEVAKMDELFAALSMVTILPSDYGDILEIALGLLQYDMDNITDEVVAELVENMTKGVGSIKGRSKVGTEVFISTKDFLEDNTKSKRKGYKFTIDNLEIISNPSSGGRQGKIDVLLELPDIVNQPFRISAKNWNSVNDFGETNLWYALSRTVSKKTALEHYMYSLAAYEANSNQLKAAHDLAKMSVFLDTIMGYSQQNNYVDTLVVNDRSKRKVHVFSIRRLLQNFRDNTSHIVITGYDENNVISSARLAYDRYSLNGANTNAFKQYLIASYINMKVSAKFTSLKY